MCLHTVKVELSLCTLACRMLTNSEDPDSYALTLNALSKIVADDNNKIIIIIIIIQKRELLFYVNRYSAEDLHEMSSLFSEKIQQQISKCRRLQLDSHLRIKLGSSLLKSTIWSDTHHYPMIKNRGLEQITLTIRCAHILHEETFVARKVIYIY